MRKKIIVSILLLVLVASVVLLAVNKNGKTQQTITVTRDTIQKTVSSTGNLQAGGTVNVYANATGIISKLYIKNGDTVVRDQKIAEIKSTATETDIVKAKAAYQSALADLKAAQVSKTTLQSQLETARKAVIDAANAENIMEDRVAATADNPSTKRTYTQEEIDSIRSSTVSARQAFSAAEDKFKDVGITIQSKQTALDLAKLNLDATKDATLKANADGTILNVAVQEGDKVQAGADAVTTTVPPIAVITDLSKYAIKLTVNETRIADIEIGQTSNLVFDSQKNVTYNGIVRTKDILGTVNQGLVSYNVYVTPTSIFPSHIQPGMTAEVSIITMQKESVLAVPQDTITTENNLPYVTVVDPNTNQQTRRQIQTGISSNGKVEILSGLAEGEQVLLGSVGQ